LSRKPVEGDWGSSRRATTPRIYLKILILTAGKHYNDVKPNIRISTATLGFHWPPRRSGSEHDLAAIRLKKEPHDATANLPCLDHGHPGALVMAWGFSERRMVLLRVAGSLLASIYPICASVLRTGVSRQRQLNTWVSQKASRRRP